jgi:hypothetical protein
MKHVHQWITVSVILTLLLILIMPSFASAELNCSSQKVLEEAYSIRSFHIGPHEVGKLQYFNEKPRRWSSERAWQNSRSFWVAGEKVAAVPIKQKGGFIGATSFQANLELTDRSLHGTKYTLCLIAIPPEFSVARSYTRSYGAKKCKNNLWNGQYWCSDGDDWILNKGLQRTSKSVVMPAGFPLAEATVQFNGTWTMSAQKKTLRMRTQVSSKLQPLVANIASKTKKPYLALGDVFDLDEWVTVPVLIMSNRTFGAYTDRAALVASKGYIDGEVKWSR